MKIALALFALLTSSVSVPSQVSAETKNPFEGDSQAAQAGKILFTQMNCAGCHGYDLTGGMGPDLTDNNWLYGGKPGEIFHTISEGTPRGMPMWKKQLTPEQIWQLVTYIQSKHAP